VLPLKNQAVQYSGVWSNNYKPGNIELSTGKLVGLLTSEGYYRLNGSFIHRKNGVIRKITKELLYEIVIALVSVKPVSFKVKGKAGIKIEFSIDPDQLKTIAQKTLKGNLTQLAIPEFKDPIARDSSSQMYFHFRNKSILVTANSITDVARDSFCVWEEQIIKQDVLEEDIFDSSIFETFVKNIAGPNCEAYLTSIGYLLRDCNGSDGLKAVWLSDAAYEPGKLKGRTGKSLLVKAIGQMRKLDLNSGKEFNHGDRFKFQTMDRDTQICIIDDAKENLSFDGLFNYCTEGVEYQQKYANKVRLVIQETPKLIITSNYPPPLEQGSSVVGRLIVLPVQPFYSSYAIQGGVKHVHGHTFFDDWNAAEWNRFYWFMLSCAQKFLKDGLILTDYETTGRNRLKTICAVKLGDADQADGLVEWLYNQPSEAFEKFSLDDLKAKWIGSEFDPEYYSIDNQLFASCLKAFFDLKGWSVKKVIQRIDGIQKRLWKVEAV
jgi:hypothetical protein